MKSPDTDSRGQTPTTGPASSNPPPQENSIPSSTSSPASIRGTVGEKRVIGKFIVFVPLTLQDGHQCEVLLKGRRVGGCLDDDLTDRLRRELRSGDVIEVDFERIEEGAARDGSSPLYIARDCRVISLKVSSNTGAVRHVAPPPRGSNTPVQNPSEHEEKKTAASKTSKGGSAVEAAVACASLNDDGESVHADVHGDRPQEGQQEIVTVQGDSSRHCSERARVFGRWVVDVFLPSCGREVSSAHHFVPHESSFGEERDDQSPAKSPKGSRPVLDVAGGKGELSLILTLEGIDCILVDPRTVGGKLSRRQRKQMRKSGRGSFGVLREEFGGSSEAAQRCAEDAGAVIALHPDEATDAVVDTAVRLRVPFAVVPCCVFARLFPHRRLEEKPVSTHAQLCLYLMTKHPAIQACRLPFRGQNTVVYCTNFDRDSRGPLDPATAAVVEELHKEKVSVTAADSGH
uniref:Methyltransferase domain-containing protein n=1 Tax=Chromera velia CCMP2878 TaxID=1169474 RepID=A0A0G4HX71_9ALVE|eukprot:Cvel_9200.t1-p1 / transcript=Cvel_9200.t1 / gene=Cvel_9200 / organism=Chromera_velia_CCMP2878 / gene_product=hypothetical protein / transcript_product=hypothetical protein / location=Cvel_scaffold524:49948-51321(-) / protein_length=458 / sequence_SO=supercontig / SO=protein_coding / is_pseudo=false